MLYSPSFTLLSLSRVFFLKSQRVTFEHRTLVLGWPSSEMCGFPVVLPTDGVTSMMRRISSTTMVPFRHISFSSSSLLVQPHHELLWQIHTHSPRRQPDPLLIIHIHARIIPIEELRVRALGPEIRYELLCMFCG